MRAHGIVVTRCTGPHMVLMPRHSPTWRDMAHVATRTFACARACCCHVISLRPTAVHVMSSDDATAATPWCTIDIGARGVPRRKLFTRQGSRPQSTCKLVNFLYRQSYENATCRRCIIVLLSTGTSIPRRLRKSATYHFAYLRCASMRMPAAAQKLEGHPIARFLHVVVKCTHGGTRRRNAMFVADIP